MKGILLIEIGTEELPINNLKKIGKDFIKYLSDVLKNNYFIFKNINYFISLSKLSCIIKNLNYFQNITEKYKKIIGPNILIKDLNSNKYEKILFWCNKNNINIKKLKFKDYLNKRYFFYLKKNKPKNIKNVIKNFLKIVLFKLKINRISMRWNLNNYSFLRPINNLIIMFDKKIIFIKLLGIKSNNITISHTCLHNKCIIIDDANKYVNLLRNKGKIIIDYNERKILIIKILKKIVLKFNLFLNYSKNFLIKIISNTEWPVLFVSKFDNKYLYLPTKLIKYILNEQNCFYTFDKNGNISNYFIIVLDGYFKSIKNIINWYNNVIESKLNDAYYLFIYDIKKPLISYLSNLNYIIFHKKIGNVLTKVTRLLFLSKLLCKYLIIDDLNLLFKSIILCKCDLSTLLCREFNHLKGYIGMYYLSLENNKYNNVALIIKDHYKPRYNNDNISDNLYSCVISLCDKIDTIVSLACINNCIYFKKSNDPFGVRRLSLSIIRIILYKNIDIDLYKIIEYSFFLFKKKIKLLNINIVSLFILKRFFKYLEKNKYYTIYVSGFIKLPIFNILEIKNRILFLINYKNNNLYDFNNLIIFYKRLKNIININTKLNFDIKNLIFKYDIKLFNYLNKFRNKINYCIKNKIYNLLFKLFIKYSVIINNYLNNVKVNDENIIIKNNRIFILRNFYEIYLKFIDFSCFF